MNWDLAEIKSQQTLSKTDQNQVILRNNAQVNKHLNRIKDATKLRSNMPIDMKEAFNFKNQYRNKLEAG